MSHYEPTSHEYLYGMPKEQLFRLFTAAVHSLTVDERGVWCLPNEAEALQRFSRAVQERTVRAAPGTDEYTLGTVATVTRVLLGHTVFRGHPRPPAEGEQVLGAGIVERFLAERARLPETLPPQPLGQVLAVGPDEEWSDKELAELPVCEGCKLPIIPGVDHSRCA